MPEPPDKLEYDDDDDEVLAVGAPVPSVTPPPRQWEFRVDLVDGAELAESSRFTERLNAIAQEGWDLYGITDVAERKAFILRRLRPATRERRPVGFAPVRAEG